MNQCPDCRIPLKPEFAFCPECGRPAVSISEETAGAVDEPVAPPSAPVPPPVARPSVERTTSLPRLFRAIRLSRGGAGTTPYDIPESGLVIGREAGDIVIAEDPTLSPRHLVLLPDGDSVVAEDAGSLNGVYLRIREARPLVDGDFFVCGDSVFRLARGAAILDDERMRLFQAPAEAPVAATVTRILEDGRDGQVFSVRRSPFVFGREDGDARFPTDRFMSRRHAEIRVTGRGVELEDLGSRNGTYVRCDGMLRLGDGDIVLIGRQLLRIEAIAQ